MDIHPSPMWGDGGDTAAAASSLVGLDIGSAMGRFASSSGGKRGRGDSPSGGSTPTGKRRAVGGFNRPSNSPLYGRMSKTPRRMSQVLSAVSTTPSPMSSFTRLSRLTQGPVPPAAFDVNVNAFAGRGSTGRKRKAGPRLSDAKPPATQVNLAGLFSSPGESPSVHHNGRGSRTIPNRDAVSIDVVRMNFSAGANAEAPAPPAGAIQPPHLAAANGDADGQQRPRADNAANLPITRDTANVPGSAKANGVADEYSKALASSIFRSDAVSVVAGSVLAGQLQDARAAYAATTTAAGPARTRKRGLFASVNPPALQCRLGGSGGIGGSGLSPPSLRQPPGRLRGSRKHASTRKSSTRSIPQVADRVLDAPCIVDDYRLTLIDWSSWVNVLAVCLTDTLYTWDASTGESSEIMNLDDEANAISCVSWMPESVVLALGTTQTGTVKLWDVQRAKQLREMGGHSERVCTVAWNQATVTTGSRDGLIIHHDVRVKKHLVAKLGHPHSPHRSEICKVLYNAEGTCFAAADDAGIVSLWDVANTREPVKTFNLHQGPVKAMAWVPNRRHTLCTGGYEDHMLNITKTTTGDVLTSSYTGCEITSLLWSKTSDELVTTGGHPTNSIAIWSHAKSEKLEKVAEVRGHNERILHMSLSPCGQTVVTCSADETIKFWKLFNEPKKNKTAVQLAIR